MTVRSGRFDFAPSAHIVSDGSGSHCKMLSESTRQISIFTTHVIANVSVAPFVSNNSGCAVPKRFHIHAQHFQSTGSCNIFQNMVVMLISGKFAVFGDTLNSFVWFSQCFAFDA